MDQQEVLIHVAAPSRLRHDRNYQSLADQLSMFEVAAMMPVYGFVGLVSDGSDLITLPETNISFFKITMAKPAAWTRPPRSLRVAVDSEVEVLGTSNMTESALPSAESDMRPNSTSLDSFVDETPAQRKARAASPECEDYDQAGLKAKRLGQWQVVKGLHSDTMIRARRKRNNPPYRNPFHGTKQPSDTTETDLQTPQAARPRTAPAGSTGTIQIARTLSATHKRSASDSFLDGSIATPSTVSDSQPSMSRAAYEVCGHQPRQGQRAHPEPPKISDVTDAGLDLQPAKRRRLRLSDNDDLVMEETARVNDPSQFESMFIREHLVRPPPGCQGPYFLRDRSEDWTSPPEISLSNQSPDTVSSTLSPSQPLVFRLSQTRLSPTSTQPSPPVDLTSDSPTETRIIQKINNVQQRSSPIRPSTHSLPRVHSDPSNSSPDSTTRSFYHNPSPSVRPARGRTIHSSGSSSTEDSRRYDFTSSIKSLPDRIEAPLPPTGSGPFTTHVSGALSTMIARLPLAKHFRPVTVARDVRVLERGHWSIRVKIASEKEVAEARRPLEQSEIVTALNRRMVGATSREREQRYESWKAAGEKLSQLGLSKRCDLWTEAEFLDFWKSLKSYVEDGKAGHGLSVAKDWAEEHLTPGRSTQSTYARIRIYTWGEVVGHVWVALWVLSDKKTAYIPMEWIASDEAVVVTMSGNRRKGGKLGPWVPKGSPGGQGSWGVAAGTPPCGQGKYARLRSS